MSNEIKINPDRLGIEVQKILSTFKNGVITAVNEAGDVVATEAVKKLKAASPKGHRGKYKKGWKKEKTGGSYTIYNKDEYPLTHLLEDGHEIIRKGEVVGHSPAIKHIAPVEEYVQNEFPKEIERQVNKNI